MDTPTGVSFGFDRAVIRANSAGKAGATLQFSSAAPSCYCLLLLSEPTQDSFS